MPSLFVCGYADKICITQRDKCERFALFYDQPPERVSQNSILPKFVVARIIQEYQNIASEV